MRKVFPILLLPYTVNSELDEELEAASADVKHLSDIGERAQKISEKTFKTPALRSAPIKAEDFLDVSSSQKGATGNKVVDVFVTSGNTSLPFLFPGCAADIRMREDESYNVWYFTRLMITEITHEVDARGYYTGHFEAIASDTGYLPKAEFNEPKVDHQIATVINNRDPKNKGRVKVQFPWQNGNDNTPFIRVMSPDAGGPMR